MPSARTTTKAPQIDELRFGRLIDGDMSQLTDDADLEGVRYAALTLPHITLCDALVASCQFSGIAADETDLNGARLSEVELERVNLPVVRAARSQWRDVKVSGRLGSLEAYEAQWRSVHFVGCKLSFVNLRGAELTDVAFSDCILEELDMINAVAHRVRFDNTRITKLNVQHSELHDFDLRAATLQSIDGVMSLRGATITADQLTLMAPLMADQIGLKVEP